MDHALSENQKTWNIVAEEFFDACALPLWAPFGIGADLNLLPEIRGKKFLEIACGSGRSVKYLIENGAEKVYALDLSERQLEEARRYNHDYLDTGKINFFHGRMEDRLDIEPVDVVFSVYGIGWTQDPETTFSHVHSYLKPGGLFIWSWDHSLFSDIIWENGKVVVEDSYHDEQPAVIWKKKRGVNAHVTYRKSSTWFQLLTNAGFEVAGYYEPEPKSLDRAFDDPTKYYSIQRAQKVPPCIIFKCVKK